MKKYILLLLAVFVSLSGSIFAQNVTLLGSTSVSAIGNGTGGKPTLNWNIPAGKNRVMIIHFWFERDHRPTVASNYPSGNFGADYFPITAGGISMTGRSVLRSFFNDSSTGSATNTQFSTIFYRYTLSDSQGLPTGATVFDFSSIITPANIGDEVAVSIEVYENVSPTTSYTATGSNSWYETNTAVSSFSITPTAPATPSGRIANDIMYIGVGGTSKDENISISSGGWTTINNVRATNNAGAAFSTSSPNPLNEADGISLVTAYRNGAAATTLTKSSTQRIAVVRLNILPLLPLAKPSITGNVYSDTDGSANINGTGTNGGGLYVNLVDTNGILIYSASVSAAGVYTIPTGYAIEGESYTLQLSKNTGTLGTVAPAKELNSGWQTVGEAASASGNDGNSDGIFNVTVGTANITGLRHGIKTCTAGTVAPVINATAQYSNINFSYTIPCGSLTANLSTLTASNTPAGTSITWHTSSTATDANKVSPVTAVGGTTKLYAAFYDSIGLCYSPTREVSIYAPICATNDNYSATPIIAGVGGTLPSIFGNDTYNGNTISLLPPNSVQFLYELWTPANAIVDLAGNGSLTIPASVPPGTYTYLYKICDNDPDATVASSCSTATVTFVVEVDSDSDGIVNSIDLDDDNDGILDTDEGKCNSTARYRLDQNATIAGATINPNGGSFNLVFTLESGGTPVPSIGNQFTIPFSYSGMSGSSDLWEGINSLGAASFAIRPNTSSLYTGLPANNSTSETAAEIYPDPIFNELLSTNKINQLGTYSVTIGSPPIPVSTDLATLSQDEFTLHSAWNLTDNGTNYTSGYYSRLTIQNDLVDYGDFAETEYLAVKYGNTYTYLYTAFSNTPGSGAGNGGNRGFIQLRDVIVEYCLDRDTDGDGIPDYLDLDSDGDGCSDAIEGAATFTNSNLANSSMPGGNSGAGYNGLSSASVTQNLGNTVGSTPTTIGVPTIAGTGQAVGQSKNGFKNDCQDSDLDGIGDWEDLDDDNDGILDTAECTTTVSDFITAFGSVTTTDIFPSDFGLALNVKNQNVSADLSAKFGYPANSGAVIVNISNASVHPTSNVWWTKNGEQPSIWKVTGTMSAFVGMAHDLQYYANDSKTFHIYDNADVIPVTAAGLANQTAVAGQWSITDSQSQKTLNNLNANSGTIESANWRYINMNFGPKSFGFSTTVASGNPNYAVTMLLECDTDKDGIPNRLDLDSDGDGCSDAIEGGASFTTSNLVNSSMAGGNSGSSYTGTSMIPVIQNLGNTVGSTATTIGIPTIAGTGQALGDSQNGAVSSQCSSACYKPGILEAGNTYPTKHGITALGRAGTDNENWPMVRQSAWTVLESKEKGFVINRVATTAGLANITNPVEGMMVYDEQADCLKIYTLKSGDTLMGWHCFTTPACPD